MFWTEIKKFVKVKCRLPIPQIYWPNVKKIIMNKK